MAQDLWNASLYDHQHQFVSKYGEGVLALLEAKKGEHILDVGCGTGDLAYQLASQGVDVLGIDASKNMVAQAQQKYPAQTFQQLDVTNLPFYEQFDAVFSNATLHWVKDKEAAILNIYQSLKPGGRFVAEFGGAENVMTIMRALIEQMHRYGIPYEPSQFPWYFPTIAEYSTLLEKHGFHVQLMHHFDRPTPLNGERGIQNWLEMFSQTLFAHVEPTLTNEVFDATAQAVKDVLYRDGIWYADYKRLRVVAVK